MGGYPLASNLVLSLEIVSEANDTRRDGTHHLQNVLSWVESMMNLKGISVGPRWR